MLVLEAQHLSSALIFQGVSCSRWIGAGLEKEARRIQGGFKRDLDGIQAGY